MPTIPCGRPGDYDVAGFRPGVPVPLCAEHAATCCGLFLVDVFKHGRMLSVKLRDKPYLCAGNHIIVERP
jgi:hypothetical protein